MLHIRNALTVADPGFAGGGVWSVLGRRRRVMEWGIPPPTPRRLQVWGSVVSAGSGRGAPAWNEFCTFKRHSSHCHRMPVVVIFLKHF